MQMEQEFSTKAMRLAVSERYGARRKVASIDFAVVLLGNFPGDLGDKLGLDLLVFSKKLFELTEPEDDINELPS